MKSYSWILTAMTAAALLTPVPALHAQAAAKPADDTPKVELFLGYTHFGAFSSKATTGNRMVGLNGGSASVAFNLDKHFALVGDAGVYEATQLLLTGTGGNLPRVVNASGTVYSYMGGPRLSFNKSGRLSPFAQVLFGGVVASAVTLDGCFGVQCTPLPKQNTFAMTGGGGLDVRVTRHIAIRAVQAEYMLTQFINTTTSAGGHQNDLRLSTGLVFRFGGGPEPLPVQLACSAQPQSVFPGDPVTVTGVAQNLTPNSRAAYSWNSDNGPVTSSTSTANIDTATLAPGTYTIKGHLAEGTKPGQIADCSAPFTVRAFEPPTVSCSANPSTVRPGDSAAISATGVSPQNRPLTYSYTASSGSVNGSGSSATLATAGASNSITVTCNVTDDKGQAASATASVTILAPPPAEVAPVMPPPPPVPMTSELCTVHFERDSARPTRVDNEAKGCLDTVALSLQRSPDAKLVLVGNTSAAGARRKGDRAAAQRAVNTRAYLVKEKGIDASRISLYTGNADAKSVTITLVPAGANADHTGSTPVAER